MDKIKKISKPRQTNERKLQVYLAKKQNTNGKANS